MIDSIATNIIEYALVGYEENGTEPDLQEICDSLNIDKDLFYQHFGAVDEVFRHHFANAVISASAVAHGLPDFGEQPLQERLAALFFVLLDTLDEHPKVTTDLFRSYASGFGSSFQRVLRSELGSILDARDVPGVNQWFVSSAANRFLLAETMTQLVSSATNDDSNSRERSAGLADTTIAFLTDVMTNTIPEKFVGLVRYSVEANYIPIDKVPIVGSWFRSSHEEE